MGISNQGVTLKGNPVKVTGQEVRVKEPCPDFVLTGQDLQDFSLNAFAGKAIVILSIPSVDTPVCAMETKRFSAEAKTLPNDVVVLVVSRDLPFAQKRFCGAESADNIQFGSDFKHRTFGKAFGVDLEDLGILARAAFVVDKHGRISYVEYVSEVGDEPKYEAILASARQAV